MALSDNISLNDAAAASQTFNLVSSSGNQRDRFDIASTLAAPRTFIIRHEQIGKGAQRADRHNLLFKKIADDANLVPQTCQVSVVITVPRDVAVAAEVDDLIAFTKNFLANSTYVTQLLRGES
ncbi:coat protein [ssRNA phage Zoerhiza.2_18]|uniref:Coat protein n=2 Tax=Leviviricetes TaxID=2842243 RepID=A0A8S5L4P7_9VIRU|nr:coat protein [ssRNA phage Zoerhiza.2_18]QDH90266.1 MAG: hypothetical protein H2Rhizo32785_000002 [Leviviridae sp.]DAD52170.1 TPA_asm: coat protein [ssRNA phage Zoerhiza.2_18]